MKSEVVKNHGKIAVKIGKFEIPNDLMFQIIVNYLSDYYQMRFATLLLGKKKDVILKRQVIQYFLSIYTTYLRYEIGHLTGNRDHASVKHSIDVVNNEMEVYALFKAEIEALDKGLENLILTQLKEK